jgi:hypothetical protein
VSDSAEGWAHILTKKGNNMAVDQQGIPDTTTDDQRMTPQAPQAQPSPDMQQAPLDNRQALVNPAQGQAPASPVQQSHQSLLNHILTMATGGDNYYTDANGQRRLAPQSSGTLGKTLIAATLAGLLAKDSYVQTPYGVRRDFAGTAGNAAEAASGVVNKARQMPQQQSDEQVQAQTRRLMTLQANANLIRTMSASAQQAHQTLQSQIDSNKPLLNDIDEAMKTLQPGEEIALAPHMSKDDAMAALKQKGYTNWTALPDGTVSVLNPETNQVEDHPTYRVVNPAAKITLSPEAADIAALTNPSFNNLHSVVGGDVRVPMSIAISANHEVMAVHVAQKEADDLVAAGLGKKTNLMEAVKKNRQLLPAIDAARDQVASGLAPWRVLDAIRSGKNGAALLDAMGISTQQAEDYVSKSHNDEVAAAEKAKAGLKSLTQEQLQDLATNHADTPEGKAAINTLAGMTAQKARDAAAEAAAKLPFELRKQQQDQNLRTGTPEDAGRLLANGDLTLTELKSRGSTPKFITDSVNAAKAIDPKYNAQKADAEYKIAGNNSNTQFFGSANSLLDPQGMLTQLGKAHDQLGNGKIPLFNKWQDYLDFQAGDPALAGFMQTLIGASDDYAKVMGGGTGSDASRLTLMHSFANSQNPQQMAAAISAARAAVTSQVHGRIGSNAIMQKMYGQNDKTAPAVGLTKSYNGANYKFDGKQWVKQ